MRIKDEAMFMSKSGGIQPVMDGLMNWIDFSAFDYENGTMNDLVTGDVYQISNFSTLLAYPRDNFCEFFPRANTYSYINKSVNGMTFELVAGTKHKAPVTVKISVGYAGNVMDGLKIGSPGAYMDANVVWLRVNDGQAITFEIPLNKLVHAVVRYNDDGTTSLYINGVKVGDGVYTRIQAMNLFSVSNYTTNNNDNRVLWAASRAYNRSLTDSEIQQNYEYEKSLGRVE